MQKQDFHEKNSKTKRWRIFNPNKWVMIKLLFGQEIIDYTEIIFRMLVKAGIFSKKCSPIYGMAVSAQYMPFFRCKMKMNEMMRNKDKGVSVC